MMRLFIGDWSGVKDRKYYRMMRKFQLELGGIQHEDKETEFNDRSTYKSLAVCDVPDTELTVFVGLDSIDGEQVLKATADATAVRNVPQNDAHARSQDCSATLLATLFSH